MMKPRVAIRDIVLIAIASALLVVMQVALSFLANIELVSLLIILYTLHFKRKTLYIIYIFAILQGVIHGFHIWWITYLYVWTILYLITMLFQEMRSPLFWAVIAAIFGILFGTMTALPYLFLHGFSAEGLRATLNYILMGIRFDLYHCVGNFISVLVLFEPLDHIFERVLGKAAISYKAPAVQ